MGGVWRLLRRHSTLCMRPGLLPLPPARPYRLSLLDSLALQQLLLPFAAAAVAATLVAAAAGAAAAQRGGAAVGSASAAQASQAGEGRRQARTHTKTRLRGGCLSAASSQLWRARAQQAELDEDASQN